MSAKSITPVFQQQQQPRTGYSTCMPIQHRGTQYPKGTVGSSKLPENKR